jgi:hypothetical protein
MLRRKGDFEGAPAGGAFDGDADGDGGEEGGGVRTIHLGDWMLYRRATMIDARGGHRPHDDDDDRACGRPGDDRGGVGAVRCVGGFPDEGMEEEEEDPHQFQYHEPLLPPLMNDPVRYNNVVRDRHVRYTSTGPDRHWDREFGDGVEPRTFVEERRRGGGAMMPTTAISGEDTDAVGEEGPRRGGCDIAALECEGYTASLLQRCWDRSVHAASSSLTVSVVGGSRSSGSAHDARPPMESSAKLNAAMSSLREESNDASSTALENHEAVRSILHNEAMDLVDGILDALFATGGSDNDGLGRILDGCRAGTRRAADWRHVLKCLQTATATKGEKVESKDNASGSTVKVCENRSRLVRLSNLSLNSLSMRLVERYGTETHRMPL